MKPVKRFAACPSRAARAKSEPHLSSAGKIKEHPMKKLNLERAGCRSLSSASRLGRAGAGRRGRQDLVQQMPGLPRDRRRRQEQGRPGAQRARRPQVRHRGGLFLFGRQQELRHHLERGRNSRNTSRIRRRRFPAPRWRSPASRTRRRSTISGRSSRNTTRTARPSRTQLPGTTRQAWASSVPDFARLRPCALAFSRGSSPFPVLAFARLKPVYARSRARPSPLPAR